MWPPCRPKMRSMPRFSRKRAIQAAQLSGAAARSTGAGVLMRVLSYFSLSPLLRGEGRGEGRFDTFGARGETPHPNPLPLRKGERERRHRARLAFSPAQLRAQCPVQDLARGGARHLVVADERDRPRTLVAGDAIAAPIDDLD